MADYRAKARHNLGKWYAAVNTATIDTELAVINGRVGRDDWWRWEIDCHFHDIVPGSFGYGSGKPRAFWVKMRSIEEQAYWDKAFAEAMKD